MTGQLCILDAAEEASRPQPAIGSLCTGYGGLDMAVQAVLGGDVVWHADNDPAASALLAHHWPAVPNLGDITATDWHQVPPIDVLAAGFPCQDLSLAGQRAGLAPGTRSGIWAHVARAIAVLRPSLVVIENVPGILSAPARGDVEPCPWCLGDTGEESALRALGAVLGDLAGLGFDAEWTRVRASDVGSAHQRARIFIVAWPADAEGEGRTRTRVPGSTPERRQSAADTDDVGGDWDRTRSERRDEPPAHGLPAADAAGVGAGEPADEAVAVADGRNARPVPRSGDRRTAADADSDGREVVQRQQPGVGTRDDADRRGQVDGAHIEWGAYAEAVARWEAQTRPAPRPADDQRRLSPDFVEWLMGLPHGWVTGVPGVTRTAQLKLLGNGVVPQQAAHALRMLLDRAPSEVSA